MNMGKLILNPDCKLYIKDNKTVYSSRQVAEEFSKRHANVLQSIDELKSLAELKIESSEEVTELKSQLSVAFFRDNFFEHKYKDESGKWSREVLMTRKGSSVLVMGFTGKKALIFKIELMNRFDYMESLLKSLEAARLEFPEFTEAIMLAHEEPKHYHFSNEINMINKIVLGMTAKEFREVNNLGDVSSIRPYLSAQQIYAIEKLQKFDIGLNAHEEDFQKRKEILTNYYKKFSAIKLLKNA